MDWFARHTYWLYRETRSLSDNSNYIESHQFIDRTLISTGSIVVRKSEIQYFPVLIVYPEATPFVPPTIYVLGRPLTEEEAVRLSRKTPADIREDVKEIIRILNRRHQNQDGSICFIEMGDLHNDQPDYYPIEGILKRLRTWLSGKIPQDSREIESFYHFPNRTHEIQYLLSDSFFDELLVKGRYFAGLISLIQANQLAGIKLSKTYMGVTIFGETKAGVLLLPKIEKDASQLLFTRIPDIADLILETNRAEKTRAEEDGLLIEGYWWDIPQEPQPFSEIEALAAYVGSGDVEDGLAELVRSLEEPLKKQDKFIHLGLRFPGRNGNRRNNSNLEWQMFRLLKGNRPPILLADKRELKDRLYDYSIQAVYQEYFTDKVYHLRNSIRAKRIELKDKYVSVIGCGALGSETADALAKAGVGRILLVDKEQMRAHNAIRHCIGINKASFPKAFVMQEFLYLHNPFVGYDFLLSDILNESTEKYLPEGYLGISTIADDNTEGYLNEQAISQERILFYCRALRGGKAARIFRVIPHKDACKSCLGLYREQKNPVFIDIKEDEALPVLANECNNPIRPASAADLKIIAGIFSRIIIEFLQNENAGNNHWIWTTEAGEPEGTEGSAFGLVNASFIPPNDDCPVCCPVEKKKVRIEKEAYEFIKSEAAKSEGRETGGVLIGYMRNAREYIVEEATGPGPKALRTSARFEKDVDYCQNQLIAAFEKHGEKGLYLGEWHYHPSGTNQPSGLDVKSMTEIAAQDDYRVDKPILIILSPDCQFALTIHDRNERCIEIPLFFEE